MKLAEALVLRADTSTRIDTINQRIKRCLIIQEGDTPPEDTQALLRELDHLLTQLIDLITRINRTNLQTLLPSGISLTVALAQRDVLTRQHAILADIADTASERFNRYSNREIRFVTTVDVTTVRRQSDVIARRRRELDTTIQATNWATELLE